MVKTIGTAARHDLEEFLGRKVFLDLRIRTEEDWRENPRIIADIKRDLHAGTTLDVDDLNRRPDGRRRRPREDARRSRRKQLKGSPGTPRRLPD